jgi:putative zinc finger protein
VMAGMHPEELELLAYLEGELDDPRRGQVASHLETCDRCAHELRAVEAGKAALRSAPMLELPAGRLETLLTPLPSRATTPPGLIRRVLPLAAALAAVAALAGGAFVLGTSGGGDDEGAAGLAQDEASNAGGGEGAGSTTGESSDKGQEGSATSTFKSEPSFLRAARVAGSPTSVARRLRRDGFDARAVNGKVIVRGATEAEVRKAVEQFDPGPVRVLVRP